MGSSVIFLVIIGLWVVFLVPHLVHHRAQLGGSRVRDRFSGAMRVLGRRPARVHGSGSRGYLHRPRPEREPQTGAGSPARPGRVRRPDRLTGVLLLGLLAVLGLAVPAVAVAALLGALPVWSVPAPVAALLALFAGLRVRAVRRRRGRTSSRPTSPVVDAEVAAVPAPRDAEPIAVPANAEPATPATTADDGTWTPVPVPPPTYTLKPPAPRRAVAPEPQPAAPAAAPPAAPPAGYRAPASAAWDLDEVLERRRSAAG